MADSPTFKEKQYAFAAHIRDPAKCRPSEGIEERRMEIYRKLFFNNLLNLLGTFFPVLRKIHTDGQWRRFIRGFMQHTPAKTPYFLQLPEEFLASCKNEYEPGDDDYPFLSNSPTTNTRNLHWQYRRTKLTDRDVDPDGDLLASVPIKSGWSGPMATNTLCIGYRRTILPDSPNEHAVYLALYRAVTMARWVSWSSMPLRLALLDAIENNERQPVGRAAPARDLRQRSITPTPTRSLRMAQMRCEEMRQLEILCRHACSSLKEICTMHT